MDCTGCRVPDNKQQWKNAGEKSEVSPWKQFLLSNDFRVPSLTASTKNICQNAKPVWIQLLNYFCLSFVSRYQAILKFTSAAFMRLLFICSEKDLKQDLEAKICKWYFLFTQEKEENACNITPLFHNPIKWIRDIVFRCQGITGISLNTEAFNIFRDIIPVNCNRTEATNLKIPLYILSANDSCSLQEVMAPISIFKT